MESKTELQKKLTDISASPLKKYLDIFVGENSLLSLFKYELITTFFAPLPGAAGFITRKLCFPRLLGLAGKNITWGRNIVLRHPQRIAIGNNTVIDDYCVLDAKGTGKRNIQIEDSIILGRNSTLSCKGGTITIGSNTNIGINTAIYSGKSVTIGKNVLFAASCYIFGDGPHRSDRLDIPIIQQGQVMPQGITIEDGVWLGANVKVLDGVTIGHDSIIGAGSIVTKNIPPLSIAVGTPAKVIRKRGADEESLPD